MFADVESLEYKITHGNGPEISLRKSALSGLTLRNRGSVTGAVVAWSYRLKNKHPHSKRYFLPPMIVGSAFAIKAIQTFASAR